MAEIKIAILSYIIRYMSAPNTTNKIKGRPYNLNANVEKGSISRLITLTSDTG
jgi:hypothetical protein